ncbi:MAG: amidohydrolase [Firmicutes bacterium]|nr:amidohydrolase [Bacillota bacterium]
MTNEQILNCAKELEDYTIQCRRTVHTFAETGGNEVKTRAFICKQLEEDGIPYELLEGTGVLGIIDSGKPGPGVVLRADIDALPMKEEPNNLKGPRVCISENPETCHSCGHDAHTAMLLASARALAQHKDTMTGKVFLAFEQGEENGSGIGPMLKALSKYDSEITCCWAIHVLSRLDSGLISIDEGPRMAAGAGIDIKVIGKGGHGSRPDLSINPVFCAAAITTNVATAWANQIPAGETVTLGITQINGGEVGNIFPDTCEIKGSMRYFNHELGVKAVDIFKKVAEHTAAMNNCRVEFGPRMMAFGQPLVNTSKWAKMAQKGISEVLPAGSVVQTEPQYSSESYGMYLSKYSGMMSWVGVGNPEVGAGAIHHNGFFDIDEAALKVGVISTLKYVACVQEEEA